MRSFSTTIVRRRSAAAATLMAIAGVVACSDAPTSPTSSATSTRTLTASPSIIPGTAVTVGIHNIWGTAITDIAAVKFFALNDSVVIFDNSAADKNPAVGEMTVLLPPSATFKACLVYDTQNFAIDVTKPYCNSAPGGGSPVNLGALVMRAFPIAGFFFQDLNGANIAASEIQLVAPPNDGFTAVVGDGSVKDMSIGGDGKIVIRANRPGTYTWCETKAPVGYMKTSPNCGTINLYWDLSTAMVLKHQVKIIKFPF